MNKERLISEMKEKITPIIKAGGVSRSALFGSITRGEMGENSDVDILVDMPEGKSLFDLVDLKMKLEEAVGRRVDLLTYKSIHPLLRENIERELITIF